MGQKESNPEEYSYKPFFDESPCPMCIVDHKTMEILDVNGPAMKLYGYSKEEFTRLHLYNMRVATEDNNKALAADLKNKTSPAFYDAGSSLHKSKTGNTFYVRIYAQRAFFEGRSVGLMIIIDENERVLTEKKNRELASVILKQKAELDDLLSSLKDIVWSARVDTFDLIYINNACTDVYGYTPEELAADKELLLHLIMPDDKELFNVKIKELHTKGRSRCEFRIQHRDGSTRYLLEETFLKRDAEGKPVSINGIAIDMTNERMAAEKIEDQHKRLQEIAWLQSHKVRSHVATVMGLIGLLDTESLDQHNKELLDNIYQTAKDLDGVIREINRNTKAQ